MEFAHGLNGVYLNDSDYNLLAFGRNTFIYRQLSSTGRVLPDLINFLHAYSFTPTRALSIQPIY